MLRFPGHGWISGIKKLCIYIAIAGDKGFMVSENIDFYSFLNLKFKIQNSSGCIKFDVLLVNYDQSD